MNLADASGFQVGLVLGLASMASIGPNNLMIIREGLLRRRAIFVASLVWGTYVALLAASWPIGNSVTRLDPAFHTALSWLGLAALAWFALQSFRAAYAAGCVEDHADREAGARPCIARVMGVVWMNPLTYIELLLVPAALGQSFASGDARLQFILALVLMSALYCYGYALGGRIMALVLRSRANLRIFDFASGLVLAGLAAAMAVELVTQ